jgi:hypothetical protein
VTACRLCRDGLDHCHGTLIVRTVYEVECSDPECHELDIERHDLVLYLEEAR